MGEYTLNRTDMPALARFIKSVVSPLVGTRLTERWAGQANIPNAGAAVLAYNHISTTDPLVVGRYVLEGANRFPHFLGKAEVFAVPVLGRLLLSVGQIPVYRGSARARDSYEAALEALAGEQIVMILPEGTLTRDPQLWPMAGKTGAARLALTTGCPLIPIAVWGPHTIVPGHGMPWYRILARLVRRHRVQVVAGPAIDLRDLRNRELDANVLAEATDRLMNAITMLLADIRDEQPPAVRMENPGVVSRPVRTPHQRSRGVSR